MSQQQHRSRQANRLQTVTDALRGAGRSGLAAYFTAGDPCHDSCLSLLQRLPAAGADVIELGIPFSDPLADGPVLQRANARALRGGQTLRRTLALVRAFRQGDDATPLVLMGYLNPVLRHGVPEFLAEAARAGVDGLILVDLPTEHAETIDAHARKHGIAMIRMSAPTTPDTRLDAIARQASGFIYHIMLAGTTGAALPPEAAIVESLQRIRARTLLPVVAGFGVRTPAQAQAVGRHADLVAVGSRLVEELEHNGVEAALHQVRLLSQALRAGTRHVPA
ncbi:Tryptophan synthase alpha chain [plant metagenome]|uniref:tryptophan synthase n=1 Tax=plant metagenome TaxID=1297885 RepID=A0A484TDH9_9ZZZZ